MSDVVQIKSDPDDISEQILALCRDSPQGIGDKFLQNEMPDVDPKARAKAINQVRECRIFKSCNVRLKKIFSVIF